MQVKSSNGSARRCIAKDFKLSIMYISFLPYSNRTAVDLIIYFVNTKKTPLAFWPNGVILKDYLLEKALSV